MSELPEWQMKIDVTGRTGYCEECEKLRHRLSDYKHQIHELRKRCEAMTREMEELRAERKSTPVVRHFDGINQEPQPEE